MNSIAQTYIELALAIDMHFEGYVESYFGPPEWKAQVQARGLRAIDELAREAASLAVAIDQSADMDSQRRDFLTRQVHAIQTSLRILQGEKLSLAEETDGLYDIKPEWADEASFQQAHDTLNELLPPGDSLIERMAAWRKSLEVSYTQIEAVFPIVIEHLRTLTRERFPLPEDESFTLQPVNHQPWGAYNWYLGGCRSRIDINTDLPQQITDLANLLAHEGYPGHHTEASIKEMYLVRGKGYQEHSVLLINSPSCVIAEAIAVSALDVIISEEEQIQWYAEEILPRAGITDVDVRYAYAIRAALRELAYVNWNAAFLLHDQNAGVDKTIAYLQRYALLSEAQARKRIEFLTDPLSRSYIFTYDYGKQLLDTLFEKRGDAMHWFTRLLTEPVTSGQIRSWIDGASP